MRGGLVLVLVCLVACAATMVSAGNYLLGAGIYDLTGESTEQGFMGYAQPAQRGTGIHFRPRSRAFIFVDKNTGARGVYISTDICMGDQMIKYAVIEKVQAALGTAYTHDNVIFSGTHTHGTPGGVGGTALVDITTLGFIQHNFDAIVLGISQSIIRAHNGLKSGDIKINKGNLTTANINRSPASYLRNPQAERDIYGSNADTLMTVLRLDADDGTPIGMISFFPVHGTSMNNTNTLVSGDNKGYASLLFEKMANPKGTLPGKGKFVAAFGQTHAGDISPNTKGPRCIDTGLECDFEHSTCNGRNEPCIAFGPGRDQFESTQIIGRMQFETARDLYNAATKVVSGPVDFRYQYNDFQNITVDAKWASTHQKETTCEAALGYAFAAGTTDGPGEFDFTQGTNSTNPFWSWLAAFLAKPTPEQIKCQAPKPILLDVGLIKPIPWVPYVLPIQLMRIGSVYLLGLPGEFSTMAGRRIKNTVRDALVRAGQWTPDVHIDIAGLSNSYSHYITTFEEYQMQRYEGASTLFGPHTLAAYQQLYDALTTAMARKQPVPLGPLPIDMRNHTFSFGSPPAPDATPAGKNFGDVLVDANASYRQGDLVTVKFVGATLRNDLFTERSFLLVEQQTSGSWQTKYDDGAWETKVHWTRVGKDQSTITIEWQTDTEAEVGTYRITHVGAYKRAGETSATQFQGSSRTFSLTA